MKTDRNLQAAIARVLEAKKKRFVELVKLAGLDPALDFQEVDLSGLNFSSQDLSGFNFSGSNLRGCNFKDARIAGSILPKNYRNLPNLRMAADYLQMQSIAATAKRRKAGLKYKISSELEQNIEYNLCIGFPVNLPDSQLRWIPVATFPNKEEKISKDLSRKKIMTYCPRKINIDVDSEPLFPGYIFVEVKGILEECELIMAHRDVESMVIIDNDLAFLPDIVVDLMKVCEGEAIIPDEEVLKGRKNLNLNDTNIGSSVLYMLGNPPHIRVWLMKSLLRCPLDLDARADVFDVD